MRRQVKNDVKFGKYEWKLNPDMRPCGMVKTCNSKTLY